MVQLTIKSFTFNDFQENTYLLHDHTKECIIIDPGCNSASERMQLDAYISQHQLNPIMLINTHCHIDHVLGNKYVSDRYNISLYAHEIEKQTLAFQPKVAEFYGIAYLESPLIKGYLTPGRTVTFGDTQLDILFVPGHAPGHICLFHAESNQLIAGDALFKGSIGRTDLPGGDYDTLINAIKTELFTLPLDTIVYSGHGDTTTIGEEKVSNPFF